ncbi:putative P2Y purinoceptor 10 [Bombina bombina]|uniref:putative P2Y purinoceptor 10 n=1 Tax=Bombina bombina TaxID=8345 RepID=UPI00235ADE85|nr:putative P2Y purinoceptor 10 [Bombina bombina]
MHNASLHCGNISNYQHTIYSTTFILIFIPGLLANSTALWVLCRFINKKNKAIIYMINLAMADLAHVLSLPLRIYYYLSHVWPFKSFLCLLCFYLKYLNMYASIVFLTVISIQRCVFTVQPFKAKGWKRRYDIVISIVVWIVVGMACLPFPLLRSTRLNSTNTVCFADLEIKHINPVPAITMLTIAELSGFIIPVTVILYCTLKTGIQLKNENQNCQNPNEKYKALRMVITCAIVFLICFAPYHINFFFYMMVKLHIIRQCSLHIFVLNFHPYSLCLASLNCCLDPILYYFTASEFRIEIARHGSTVLRNRLMSHESSSSFRD